MDTILIVEDDQSLNQGLSRALRAEGREILACPNLRTARQQLSQASLVLLDVNLPDGNGVDFLREVKETFPETPVILLTANDTDLDIVDGLEQGADDYITKPFSPAEVLARVRSHLRRYTRLGSSVNLNQPLLLRCGGIELDREARQVTCDGDAVALTPREYDILLLLMQNIGKVFSPREIYQQVWREMPMGAENVIAVHIRHLREKLEINPAEPRYLKVVWGQGYKLEEGKG